MSTTTTNYSLTKPATTDLIDISVLNGDLDTIDTQLFAKPVKLTAASVVTAVGPATVAANTIVPTDTTSNAVGLTLPSAPADGTRVTVKQVAGATNATTITRGGTDVFNKTGGSTSLTLNLLNQAVTLQYATSGGVWYVVSDDLSLTGIDARYVSQATTVNSHALSSNVTVTASDVGLGNCDNTSDANKPVSSATTTALGNKVSTSVTVNGHALSSNVTVTASDVAAVPVTEVVNTVASAGTAQTLAEPGTKSINDLTLDNASPCVLTFPTSTAGTSFTLILRQSGSTRTVTWPGGIKWAGGVAPTLSTTTGSIDIFSFVYVTAWNGFVAGLAMA